MSFLIQLQCSHPSWTGCVSVANDLNLIASNLLYRATPEAVSAPIMASPVKTLEQNWLSVLGGSPQPAAHLSLGLSGSFGYNTRGTTSS